MTEQSPLPPSGVNPPDKNTLTPSNPDFDHKEPEQNPRRAHHTAPQSKRIRAQRRRPLRAGGIADGIIIVFVCLAALYITHVHSIRA